jgi:Fe-S-cluster formation regulator IscX/YfhJ
MIQLHPDCLIFQTTSGEAIPCSAELVTVELMGDAADLLDPEIVRNAARAVLHYFKVEKGKTFVSVGEFSEALASVLRGFGLVVKPAAAETPRRITDSDLRQLACESGKGFELAFFPRLRDELRQQLNQAPQIVRFTGLRSCVKQLSGARRWTDRCQRLNDQIVEFLRHCLTAERQAENCSLLVV